MWRPFFSAVGIILLILGVEFLLVDEAVLADSFVGPRNPSYDWSADESVIAATAHRNFTPPEWAPYSLLSSGAVVLLYALAMRSKGGA